MKTKVDIRDYGAKSGIDCSAMFQKAEDDMSPVSGIIQVPKGVFECHGFYHRNNVTLQGKGDTSILRNSIKPNGTPGPDQFVIYLGNFAPSTFAECIHSPIADIKAGSNKVILSFRSNYILFQIGQTVLIDSTAGFMSSDKHWKPYVTFINRVTAVAADGVITLEDPISIDIIGANIALTTSFAAGTKNDKSYIVQGAVIQNIRFESLYGDWAMRWGAYKTLVQNISIKSTDGIAGNGFAWCTLKNIRIEFSQKVIEMAIGSHNTTVDGLTATWWNGVADPDIKPLIKMGENMRDCELMNLDIDSGLGKNFGMVIRFEHAYNNKIHHSNFNCPTISQNGIELTTADAEAFVQGNEVSDCVLALGNSDSYIKLDDKTDTGNMTGNKIINNTFSGKVRKKPVIDDSDSSNIIQPNEYL